MKDDNNKDLEKTDVLNDENDNEFDDADVTRNINLDDLYDGAVNNTVVIDPVTNNEVLLSPKKPNFTFLGVILAIIILLLLYYVNNKSDFTRQDKDVKPNTTTTTIKEASKNGVIYCKYQSKSDNENEEASYTIEYEDSVITKSMFSYSVIVTSENASDLEKDLESQYENLYTKNSGINGMNVSFIKNNKGFTFNSNVYYKLVNFDEITIEEGKTLLFIKPNKEDTITNIKTVYDKKGYTCTSASE